MTANIGESLEDAHIYRNDKQRAYKEGFKELESTALPITLNGVPFRYHPTINFYVDMTAACNCSCWFCIANVEFNRQLNPRADLVNVLDDSLHTLSPMSPSIQITGGEPTLFNKKLIDMLKVVHAHKIHKSVLNTNGFDLNSGVARAIIKYGIDHVDISRHHYNDKMNDRIMGGGINSDKLREYIEPIADKARIQCNLISTRIDTYDEVMQFIAYAYHKLGATNVMFASLTTLPEGSYYDESVVKHTSDIPVDTNSIMDSVEKDNKFYFEKYRGGVAYYYEIWKFTGYDRLMTIVFKHSDNHWLGAVDNDPKLMLDVVLHTDGTLAGSRCKDVKILCKY